MAQHYTRNTVSAAAWCPKCQANTQHSVHDRRIGSCLVCLERLNQDHDRTTEAQFTLCRQHLRQDTCPICDRPKEGDQCFCKHCYFALPKPMRNALWIGRMDKPGLIEWAQNYMAAKDWLRKHGMDQKSGNLFEAIT